MTGTTVNTELIKNALMVATRAPSLHNSQPWSWIADGSELQLHLDRSRIVRYTDTAAREALISCGVMLDHLRVTLAAAGWQTFVQRFPNPKHPEHLASVDFWPAESVTAAAKARANAILLRRTDRLPLLAPANWDVLASTLTQLIDPDKVQLDVLPGQRLAKLARVSTLTEAVRRLDAEYQSELDWWTAPFDLDQGIPRNALNSVAEADRVENNRRFPAGSHPMRRTAVTRDDAQVLILSTTGDDRADALACGEALSTVLLECTAAGLATCTVTHLTEVPAARAMVAELIDDSGVPQVLIRVGAAPALDVPEQPTPRRDLDDVLRVRR
jgi:nitroreductase